MVSKECKIVNQQGMHMRPANTFVSAMTKYQSDVTILFGGKEVNAKSIMNLMAACIKFGSEITVTCSGPDEQAALEEAVSLIESGFGE